MVGMAKLVIAQIVALEAEGSNPSTHPFPLSGYGEGIFLCLISRYDAGIFYFLKMYINIHFYVKFLCQLCTVFKMN